MGSHSDTFNTANSQEGDEVMRRGDDGEMEGFVYVYGEEDGVMRPTQDTGMMRCDVIWICC